MILANHLYLLASVFLSLKWNNNITLASLTELFGGLGSHGDCFGGLETIKLLCYEFTCGREAGNTQGCRVQMCGLFPVEGIWPPCSAYQTCSLYPTCQTITVVWAVAGMSSPCPRLPLQPRATCSPRGGNRPSASSLMGFCWTLRL